MESEEQVWEKEFEDSPAKNDFADYNYIPDPIRNPTELDAKIIQSDYKDLKITIRKPIFKKIEVAQVYRKRNGEPRILNGKPVLKGLREVSVFDRYEEEDVDFPIKKLYTDSLTSSILDKEEAGAVRALHDLVWVLGMKTLTEPDTDYTSFMNRLNGAVATLLESSKSIGGGGIEFAKTTITKGESRSYDFRQSQDFDEYKQRVQNQSALSNIPIVGRLFKGGKKS